MKLNGVESVKSWQPLVLKKLAPRKYSGEKNGTMWTFSRKLAKILTVRRKRRHRRLIWNHNS